MIDFFLNLVYVLLLWGSIIVGAVFLIRLLSKVLPHACWDKRESKRFDPAAIFCIRCIEEIFARYFTSRVRYFVGFGLLVFTPSYILLVLLRAHYVDEFNVSEMVIVGLLCLLTHFCNYEYYRVNHIVDPTMPIISGCAFFAVFSLYFRLTVNFVLVSMVLCFFNMMICGLQRCVLYFVLLVPERDDFVRNRRPVVRFADEEQEQNVRNGDAYD